MEDKVVRKRTTKKVARRTTARKAPTRVPVENKEGRNLLPFVVLGVFTVVIGISVAVGFSGDGQINVADTINERKNNATTEEERTILETVQVQKQRPAVRNAGLVPSSKVDNSVLPPAPATEVSSSTATSTSAETDEADSSSEDDVVNDVETTEPEPEVVEESSEQVESAEVTPESEPVTQ